MSHTIPIINPRTVPSIAYLDWAAERALSLPILPHAFWHSLNPYLIQSLIQTALMNADCVKGLWAHDAIADAARPLRLAAVLILLVEQAQGCDVVLTTRASHLRHHAGQVSFVGGKMEHGESAQAAALREAREEIGLEAHVVQVLGQLPVYQTITGFQVAPVVAWVSQSAWQQQNLQLDANEVDDLFVVPIARMFELEQWRVHTFDYAHSSREFLSTDYLASNGVSYFIWGASMAMLHNLMRVLLLNQHDAR